MKTVHFAVAALALAAASVASAQTVTYTSSAAFLPNVAAGSYTETFADPSFSGELDATFSSGAFSYVVSAPGGLYGNGTFIGTNLPNETLTITFTGAPVTAVGGNFWATNISDVFQAQPVTVTLSNGTTTSFTPTSATVSSYRGFTSTLAITSLTLSSTAAVYAGMDNFTVGSAVPEPTSYMLFALGLGGLLLARRRQASV